VHAAPFQQRRDLWRWCRRGDAWGNALPPSRDGDVAAHLQSPLVLTTLTT